MKVTQVTSDSSGNAVANQFIIDGATKRLNFNGRNSLIEGRAFQSYDSMIVLKANRQHGHQVFLDRNTWDYSKTTGRYRNQFLGETKKETEKKIADGTYKLADLN